MSFNIFGLKISLKGVRFRYLKNLPRLLLRWQLKSSVTRSGDFLHFGQLFKAFGNN